MIVTLNKHDKNEWLKQGDLIDTAHCYEQYNKFPKK